MRRYFHPVRWAKWLIRKSTLIFLLFSLCYFCACSPERNSKASPHKSPSLADDTSSIDTMVKAIYESITFPEGEEPNMERFRQLFATQASFIRVTPEGTTISNTEGFISSFKERISSGKLKSFSEAEISRRTNVYAHIAQVFSAYQKIMNPHDGGSPVRGINSLQLYHDGERWWISSITWEDEQSDNLIPDEYLPKKRLKKQV